MQNTDLTKGSNITYIKNRRNNQEFDIYEYKNGIYQGDIFDFKREGYGIYLWDDGQIYIGEWKDDQIEGMGIVFFGFGGYVYGKFVRNKLHGPGILTFPNGDIYACTNWDAGKLNERVLKYNNEDRTWQYIRYIFTVHMEGIVDNERIHSEFLEIKEDILKKSETLFEYKEYFYTFPYTTFYKDRNIGKFKAPPVKCIDFISSEDDSWYFGIVSNGIPDGLGITGTNKQIKCRGVFKNGNLNGIGRSQLPNGDIYDGVFLNGELNIGFVYIKNDERFVYANYEKGCLKNILKEGKGFPYNLLSACKHNIYIVNLSYYYKYTAIEVIYVLELGKQAMALYPYVLGQSNRKHSPANSKIRKETPKKQQFSKNSYSPSQDKEKLTKHGYESPSLKENTEQETIDKGQSEKNSSPVLKEEKISQQHSVPKETDPNAMHRKSLSVERSKYSEMLPESPQKDHIQKCTFNNDTPKKVSLPPKESLLQTNKQGINDQSNTKNSNFGVNQVLNENKPTNLEYSAFLNSQNYYNEKIGEIMHHYHDNGDIEPDDEKPLGKVNALQLKKSIEGPPSFGEIPEKIYEKQESNLEKRQKEDFNGEDFKKSKPRSSQEKIKENYGNMMNNSSDLLNKNDLGMSKNALIIYYDNKRGLNEQKEINLNEYDCRYYNMFQNQLERPMLHIHEKVKLEVEENN